jgi:hypothetical protein
MSDVIRRAVVRTDAVLQYLARRAVGGDRFVRAMIEPAPSGRDQMSAFEREQALRRDVTLRRLGVRCLWRAAIVTQRLRADGVAARVGLSVSSVDPRRAHAETEVAGVPLRPHGAGSVRLR